MDPSAWRHAWRSLRRRPLYLFAAVLTLALGGAVTTAVFSLVDTVLIKPLPYPDADRLVTVYESSPAARDRTSLVAPGRLEDWERLNRTFVALSGSYSENVTDTSASDPERLEGRRVAPRYFTVFGTAALAGRTFTDEEERANGPAAVVISEHFWERRFHRDPSAIGRALIVGGRSYPIVGVLPAAFTGAPTDVWLPAQFWPGMLRFREARFLSGIGRMRPGVSREQASHDLASVQAALGVQFPKTDSHWSVEIRGLKDARIGDARRGLVLVFGAVSTLWIIAVANIAGLMLVQLRRRTRELAIRAALGASRLRVIGTVIREAMLIAAIGGALGAVMSYWLVGLMPAALAKTPRINELTLDLRSLAFVAISSVLAGCIFSLVPAFAATRSALTGAISMRSRTATEERHAPQKILVVAQVALSVVLVGSATLLLRTYYTLTQVDTGFDASGVVTFHVGARWDEDRTRIGQLQQQLLERLQQLPHVQAAGMTNFLPATGATLRYQVRVDGLTGPNADGSIGAGARMVNSGYLRAIRAPLIAGSWCASPPPGDFKTPRTAMINRRFVDLHGDRQNLIGRSLRITQGNAEFTIAGIIGDLAEDGPSATAFPYVYTCDAPGAWPDPEYVARTRDAAAFSADLRRIVRELDASRAVFGLKPLQTVLDAALDQPRLDAAMLGLFAGAAVVLAAMGLYTLFMLVVSERGREIAVRLAIGARPFEMMRLVMTDAGRLLASGLVSGIVLIVIADRLLRRLLFGAGGLDLPALAAAVVVLVLVALVAVAIPAIKAARVAPVDALRAE